MAAHGLTEGERWARDELERLKAAGFSPRAVARFLAASNARASAVRAARPDLARQSRRWMAAGGAAWAGLGAVGAQPFRRRARAGLAWWASTALMLDWHLGMVETEHGRERPLGAGDALTLARAWLVPVAFDTPSPLVCALAGASDVLDGRLARAAGATRIGRDLEGLVDFSFAVAALRGARRRGWIGRGAVAAELARLASGFGYGLWVYFGRADAPDPAVTGAARVTTPVRVAGLVVAGAGRRRLADVLVIAGSVAAVGLALRTVAQARGTKPSFVPENSEEPGSR